MKIIIYTWSSYQSKALSVTIIQISEKPMFHLTQKNIQLNYKQKHTVLLFLRILPSNDFLARQRRETTTWSNQRWSSNFYHFSSKILAWIRTMCSGKFQAATKNSSHYRDGVLCFFTKNTRWSELFAEIYVTVQSFFSWYEPIWPQDFIFNCFDTKPTNPSTLVSLTNSMNICRGAILC